MALHKLEIKVGAIAMVLRNLNMQQGICNGTRVIIRNIYKNILDVEIISGNGNLIIIFKLFKIKKKFKFLIKEKHIGSRIFLPRVDLYSKSNDLPFILKRKQYPIRLAFFMTINKSQVIIELNKIL